MTLAGLLSIGIFVVVSTGANRVNYARDAHNPASGTGGYDFYVETSLPVNADLSTPAGQEKVGIDTSYAGLSVVQLHRYVSDDASCLNLNRVKQPSILGVDPAVFIREKAFSFAKVTSPGGWNLLNQKPGPRCIPAIADQTVITWGIDKQVGDSIPYVNEQGDSVYLVLVGGLANSVFQGYLLVSASNFLTLFPSIGGSNILLAGVQADQRDQLQENLAGALRAYGVQIDKTAERLEQFNSVTNTYLDIFIALGGIALIIGTFGFAIVVIRSIDAGKSHYAMMQAYGIPRRLIRRVVTLEFVLVLFAGWFTGIAAALTASLPGLLEAVDMPVGLLGVLSGLFIVSGLGWIVTGTSLSLKADFIPDLRNDFIR